MISDSTSITTGREVAQHAQQISGSTKLKQQFSGNQGPGLFLATGDDSGLEEALTGGGGTATLIGARGSSAIGEIDDEMKDLITGLNPQNRLTTADDQSAIVADSARVGRIMDSGRLVI